MATTLSIELPSPHAAQRQILSEAKRFNVLACGRRWGKSTLGIDRIIEMALQGQPCGWFAPTYKHLLDVWRELTGVLQPVIRDKSESERRLQIAGGGVIECWSMDSAGDSARGRKYKLVVVDEAALVPELERAWQATLRPMLTDLKGGSWFLSTPRGINDFKGLYDRGQDEEREDWASWQMPTSTNPYIDAAEIEAARKDMSEAQFNQEFLAQFVAWEGALFRRVMEAATASPGAIRAANHTYAIGIDWGRSVDYTVFVVIDATTRTVVEIDRSNRADYAVQIGRLKAMCGRWRPAAGLAELNSIGQPILEQVWREGMLVQGFTTTNASKAAIVEGLALAIECGQLRIPPDPVLLAELQAFRAEPLPSGMMRYAAPAGQHDDCVMALALAWAAATAVGQRSVTLYMNPDTGMFGTEPYYESGLF
jgi:phage FluMu gp28-like protein